MNQGSRILFGTTMSLALGFGFLHLFFTDFPYDFNRLHIFLFNLCSGGAILLHFGMGVAPRIPTRVYAYFTISVVYALTAFLNLFWATLLLSVPLILIVESVRIRRFGLLPFDFFRRKPTSEKFLQASLLCLSIGMTIASLVIINSEYYRLVTMDKLTLDVFFLGYSFPLSLLTFSVMYSFMRQEGDRVYNALREVSFWSITLGVIFFFVFIIFEVALAEVIISNTLLLAVLMTYYIFLKNCRDVQPRRLLASGMMFLVITAITGVMYLFEYLYPPLTDYHEELIMLHATIALYGWNLSGLFVIVRWDDFPISRSLRYVIALHWITVLILAPLGKHYQVFSVLALLAYISLLALVFLMGRNKKNKENKTRQEMEQA